MVAFPIDHATMAPLAARGLEILRVTDDTGIDDHRDVVTAGFGSDRAVALGTACPDLLDRPDCVVYVGYADGGPVASGLGWRSGGPSACTASRPCRQHADAGTGRR